MKNKTKYEPWRVIAECSVVLQDGSPVSVHIGTANGWSAQMRLRALKKKFPNAWFARQKCPVHISGPTLVHYMRGMKHAQKRWERNRIAYTASLHSGLPDDIL